MTILCLILTALAVTTSVLIYRNTVKQKGETKKFLIALTSFLILSIGLELSLFNINFYNTQSLSPVDKSYVLEKKESEENYFNIENDYILEIPEINEKLSNIYINLSEKNEGIVKVRISLTDESNEFFFNTPERTLYTGIEKSQYLNVHTSGETEKIRITFQSTEDEIKIDSIEINALRPFEFSLLRVLIVIFGLLFLYILKPSSFIYTKSISSLKTPIETLCIPVIALQCVLICLTGSLNPLFTIAGVEENGYYITPYGMEQHNQYDELALAVLEGKTYIDNDDIPQSLKDMENPYDTTARAYNESLTGDKYRWDVAYYNGHYYVYFGIVPMLLLYLPCRAIFETSFPTFAGIIVFACLFSIGICKLLNLICKKYFSKTSSGTFLLILLSVTNCCGMMFLVKRPDFYSLPIIMSMTMIVFGLYLWLKGINETKKKKLYFFGGALLFALSVGCRPQSVLISFVAIPIFWNHFFKNKDFFTKEKLSDLLVLAAPYIVVALGIMYYNYIRFDSPFDFGSGYNLTTNDVSRRGFDIGRTGLGLFTYLFQPPQFTATFPYIKNVSIETSYIGKTIYEFCFGGLIASTPVLWFTFSLPKVKENLKSKNLLSIVSVLLLIGISLVVADTQAGGLLQRYYSDFGYIFLLACGIIILSLYERFKSAESTKIINKLLFISTIFSLFYTICLVFSVADVTIDTRNPNIYGMLLHTVEFWL